MTRDSAAVAALDDRRRSSSCPVPGASDAVDGAPSSASNGIIGGSSGSNGGGGGVGDGGGSSSPKSSSAVSTATSCCGGSTGSSSSGSSSSSGGGGSRSGSDDDDSVAAVRPSAVIDRSQRSAEANALPPLPSLHNEAAAVDRNGDKDSSSSSSNSVDATTADTSTSIGGRLTFYKDGQFIFQLAAHHQQRSYNNQSTITSPCRWVPVPTVIQQHKNNVKSISEWSKHQQNKTIWPYSVTNPAPESKSPQTIQQSQPPVVRLAERKQQQYQNRTTPPPLTPISGAVNVASCTTAVVMATTTNIVRRPSRKCSTTTAAENTSDVQNKNWHLQSQLRPLSKRIQPYQHQSFIMVATKAIKAQRRLLSLPYKQHRRCRKIKTGISRKSLLHEKQPPSINLECVVRNLWCRRHTTDLLLRRQLSINHSIDTIAITAVDTSPTLQHLVATTGSVDSTCPIAGNGKRRSIIFTPSTTTPTISTTATTNSMGITDSSSPLKKYRLGQMQQILQQQQPAVIDKSVKKTIPQPLSLPLVLSNNNHSITAILSGSAAGETRSNGSGVITSVADTESCTITSTTTTTTSAVIMPQKIPPLSSPAPLSLLRTLLKSPSGEIGLSPIVACTNGVYKHHSGSSRKRSAVESTTVLQIPPSTIAAAVTTVDKGPRTTMKASPSTAGASKVNVATAALTALHQLPNINHPLATTGYFNVLYHQAAMAAAMAYQNHSQMPKSQPPLLSSLFSAPVVSNNSWQRQLNRRTHIQPPTKVVGGSGTTEVKSASTIVAPYSSPLIAAAINGSGLLPPATQSPPPPLHLHSHSVHQDHHHNLLLQQYQPVPTVQKPPQFSHHQYKQRQQGNIVKQRTAVTAMDSAEYGDRIDGKNVGAVDVKSSSSTDCMPLNLSKDSVAENVDDTAATVR